MSWNTLVVVRLENDNSFFVSHGDRVCEGVTFDEMLGIVAAVMMPEKRPCVGWLRTAAEERRIRESLEIGRDHSGPLKLEGVE